MATVSPDARVHACLRQNPYTAGLPPRLINVLAEVGRMVVFSDGEYLFRQGDDADYIYLICRGAVWLQSKSPEDGVHVWKIDEGGLVGWSCVTPPYRYLLDARAEGVSETVRLDAHEIRKLLPVDHELGYHLFQVLLVAASERLMPHRPGDEKPSWPPPLLSGRKNET